uniref:G_PROTEIN_RECEP_F1_2 domain-containing protein n=1 Tax=Ascaris lumbricoides TaxID=6252 RepID=A0A0M3I7T9_ASCLU
MSSSAAEEEDSCVDTSGNAFAMIILLCGSVFSLVSIVNNSILFINLLRSTRTYNSHLLYILILAFFDLIVSLCYVPVIVVDYLKDQLQLVLLAKFWWSYFNYLLSVTHVAMSASCFILVFVSIERYMLTVRSAYLNFARRNRSFLCILAIVGALLMKAPIALELELKLEKQCIGTVSEYVVDLSNRCASLWYGTIYRFWIRNIVTVFTPFILIIHINLRIVSAIKSQVYLERICSMQKASKHKVRFSSTP